MATFVTPVPVGPAMTLAIQLGKAGQFSDKRFLAALATVFVWLVQFTIGWPAEEGELERMDLQGEEDTQQFEELRDVVQLAVREAEQAPPEGAEAFKLGDGTLLKMFGPMLIEMLMKFLAGRTTPPATG